MKTNRKIKRPPARRNKGKWKLPEYCSNPECGAHNSTKEMMLPSVMLIKGEEIAFETLKYRCVECEMTFQSTAQATEGVKLAVAEYQKKYGFMTAEDLKETRKELGIPSAAKLAELSDGVLSEATLKRIESGVHAQDKATDYALCKKLEEISDALRVESLISIPELTIENFSFSWDYSCEPTKKREKSHEQWNLCDWENTNLNSSILSYA